MQKHEKIGEPELRQYEAAGVINAGKIIHTPDGYVLVVSIGARAIELTVHSYRGHPRTWASLDRMLNYLRSVIPSVVHYELILGHAPAHPDSPDSADAGGRGSRSSPGSSRRR